MIPLSPVMRAALGAGVSYYGFFPLLSCLTGLAGKPAEKVLIALLAGISLGVMVFCVLCRAGPRVRRSLCWTSVKAGAALIGFWLGIALSVPPKIAPGLPLARVTGLYGTLREDPRHSGWGRLRIYKAAGTGGVKVSAWGTVAALFPPSAIPRLRAFGRGGEVYIEGRFLSSPEKPLLFRSEAVWVLKDAPTPERIRARARDALYTRFSTRPWGALALALLLGVKDNFSSLDRAYRDAGCSHILALSGMHLAIIAGIMSRALKPVLGLKPAALVGMLGILSYVYLVGNLPSLNRAAIMYVLGTAAALGMFPKQGLNFLGLSFLIQLCLQKEAGRSVSFMLSYLALLGILTIGNSVSRILEGRAPRFIASPLAASFGAFIAAAPVAALFFGTLRPFGIITGLALAPLTSLFMLISMVSLPVDALFSTPVCDAALSGLYAILEWLARQGARLPGVSPPAPLMAAAALLIALLCRRIEITRREVAPFDYTL